MAYYCKSIAILLRNSAILLNYCSIEYCNSAILKHYCYCFVQYSEKLLTVSLTSTQVESICNDLTDLSQVEKNRLTPNTSWDVGQMFFVMQFHASNNYQIKLFLINNPRDVDVTTTVITIQVSIKTLQQNKITTETH